MAFNIGINVLETDGKATPALAGAPVSVGAYLIRSARGLPNTVYKITGMGQVRERFGFPIDGAYGYYALKGFFDNGGVTAYVVRIAKDSGGGQATAASHVFDNVTVTAGYLGKADPGHWGMRVAIQIVEHGPYDPVPNTFDILVKRDQDDKTPIETWDRLSNAPNPAAPARKALDTINDPNAGSKYIMIAVSGGSSTNPGATEDGGKPVYVALGEGHENGNFDDTLSGTALTDAFKNGWNLFDPHDVQLLACPESNDPDVARAALDYCAGRGDCMYLGHTSENDGLDGASAYTNGNGFRENKVYGAIYFPWIWVSKEGGGRIWVPPVGHVMGVYARTEAERGIWKAPAGVQAGVRGVLDIKTRLGDVDHTDLVKNGSVNAIRYVAGAGFIVDSSRTLSTNPLWYYVNVRLLFNYVKSTLRSGLRWVVQEPNTEELWKKVSINTVRPFLMGLWRKGAFGPGKPDDVFTIKCDAENNPPANIQLGIFTLEVYFYPSRPAETVVIVVGQQEGKSSASEA